MSQLSSLQNPDGRPRLTIVGGGIVGAALAAFISEPASHQVVLIDRSLGEQLGSTGHAPGLVGQLNESQVLTNLAIQSVKEYKTIPNGWDTVGALEVYPGEHSTLAQHRLKLARTAKLAARIVDGTEASRLAPAFVSDNTDQTGLYFPTDGTANAVAITQFYLSKAKAQNATLVEADYLDLDTRTPGTNSTTTTATTTTYTVQTSLGTFTTNQIVFATGIWTPQLLARITGPLQPPLPIIPVAHPYVYFARRPPRPQPSPFVRWPAAHVYARDHGDRDGFGTYAHPPMAVQLELELEPQQQQQQQQPPHPNGSVGPTPPQRPDARTPWPPSAFDSAVAAARTLLTHHHRATAVAERVSGVFAVTPDNLPLAGFVPAGSGSSSSSSNSGSGSGSSSSSIAICAAVWITHAAGTARFVADLVLGGQDGRRVDASVARALDPGRFFGGQAQVQAREAAELRAEALRWYSDIYGGGESS